MEYQRTTYARFDPKTGEVTTQNMEPNEPDCLFWIIPWGVTANDLKVHKNSLFITPPKPTEDDFWEFNFETEGWFDPRPENEIKEIFMRELRTERDRRLAASDWADTVSAQKRLAPEVFEAWATYRQALRDMPLMTQDPSEPEWPVSP